MSEASGRIVVGYDASQEAQVALRWAVRTAYLLHQELDVVIAESPLDPVFGDFHRKNQCEVEMRRDSALGLLRDTQWADWGVRLVHGHTVPILLAEARSADLLVVGSERRSLAAGTFRGSVSQHVVRHARCPVVVVRGPRERTADTIVVGVEGSVESFAALRFAVQRASTNDQRVHVVYAYPEHLVPRHDVEAHRQIASPGATASRRLSHWLAESRPGLPPVRLSQEVVAGPAAPVLIECSREASLVVTGSRGRDAFAELLLGSTAQAVLHDAECPVTVVR